MFLQVSLKITELTSRDQKISIARQILGQETYNFIQILYKLIFKEDYYVFVFSASFFAI